MKKLLVTLACLVAGTMVICATAAFADEMCVPMGSITLEAPQGAEAKRSAVEFPHSQHFALHCGQCHHNWEGDDEIQGCMTSGCHDATQSMAKENPGEAYAYYKQAFHKSCIGCHKERAAKNKAMELDKTMNTELLKTGPTGCSVCHPK